LRRRRAVKQQMQAERDFTAGLQEIVRTARHTLKIPAAAETPPQASGIQQLLEEVRMEPVQHRRRTELEQERLDTLEGHLNRDREQEKAIHDRLQQQRLELNGILRPFSAGNTEDLNRRKDEIQRSRDRLHEEQQRLAETMQQYGIQDIGILRDELGRRIDTLSEQIQVNTPSEEERRALSVQLEAIRSRKREVQEELSRCRIDHQRYRTAYDSRFGSLPDEYMQLEHEIERVRSLQQNIEMERQAAEIAAGIVGELNSDTGEQLQQLGSQVADWFGDILNVPRTVRFYGFDDSLIQIEDAGGTARDINKLSSGTRDAFYLAARLALIAESNLNPGLVILDDPCITLDPERTGQAMQVLVRFLQSTGHQVVFLSKDPATAEYLRSALPDEIAERDFTEHVLERQPTLS
ncbi:MAG: ATP-binding protein, partial [Spirochaeta sp.]